MTKGWVFGLMDLKDVYFFINIILNSSGFFRFKFDNTLYLFMGRGCSSVVELLPKERKAFGSNPVSPRLPNWGRQIKCPDKPLRKTFVVIIKGTENSCTFTF